MPTKVGISKLNASTMDILNTIRANASASYQQYVPTITQANQITKIGDVLMGYPSLANEFISSLVNRIAFVRLKSATFNNMYAKFKKGYIETGETIEEVFVNLCKAREFNVEKAEAREFKRTIPDVRTAFHNINYRVQYPITIQDEDLRQAFVSLSGVTDLIGKIIDSVYRSAEYDEFLLFKYLIIKGVTSGKFYPVPVDMSDMKNAAVKFRGISNTLPFINTKYNAAGVHTNTDKSEQEIFMDANFNAEFDVNVLASAFNMDKADFMGRLNIIDDWTTFDNDRFDVIRAGCDGLEEVTSTELNLMANVKAIIIDPEWFQVYDNLARMSEQFVASGLYWNYFYNIWKTVSTSPFSNAVVFVDNTADTSLPDTITLTVDSIIDSGTAKIVTFKLPDADTLEDRNYEFIQDDATAIAQGVAVHRYGAYIIPSGATISGVYPKVKIGGVIYTSGTALSSLDDVGDTATLTRSDFVANTLSAFSITSVTFSPSFASATGSYTGTYSAGATARTITATPTNNNATVKVYKKTGSDGTYEEITGTTKQITMSSAGHYFVKVVVTGVSEGVETTKTYEIDITAS